MGRYCTVDNVINASVVPGNSLECTYEIHIKIQIKLRVREHVKVPIKVPIKVHTKMVNGGPFPTLSTLLDTLSLLR